MEPMGVEAVLVFAGLVLFVVNAIKNKPEPEQEPIEVPIEDEDR